MAATLFKLVIEATTTTTTEINPEVEKYFYEVRDDDRVGNTLVIPAEQFIDDDGNNVVGNLTTAAPNNGYYLLFINGVLQQSSLFTVSPDGSEVEISDADTIPTGAPITLIVNNFAPDSDSDTTIIT